MTAIADRILAATDRSSGCWLWTASRTAGGYGRLQVEGKLLYVHRLAYEDAWGPIPDGLVIDHLCNTPPCCNPLHLNATTHRENTLRGLTSAAAVNARKTHCIHGHPFDEANTYCPPGRPGRKCRTCVRESSRRLSARRKAQRAAARAAA